ncbi:MAG: hypothetical protein IT332_04000 [Ardenticatenales bacterium]|nr:hypothetical protein [Ardenticatenales bacterium]
MPKHPMPDVIVLLPGIMGSVLQKDGKPAWGFDAGGIARALFTRGDSIAEGLRLGGDDPARETLDDGVTATALLPDLHLLPGFWKIDGYGHVADVIRTVFDVKEGENFFRFPYDWRRDNRASARKLQRASRDWLAAYRRTSPQAKLILVAHSMGGLVSRYFLEVLEGWKDTKALITFGTPYRGSLNALDTLSNGMRKGPLKLDALSTVTRSFTSTYQLLPTYKAYDAGDGTLVRVGESVGIPNVDPLRAKAALAFHREIIAAVDAHLLEPAYMRNRYRIFPIVGTTQSTLQSGRLAGGTVVLEQAHDGQDMSGDGTVPRVSAVPHEDGPADSAMYAAMKHGSLQNTDAVLQHLEGAITSLYIDLGKFLAPDRRAQLALSLEDVYFDDEPVLIGVDAGSDRLQLVATAVDATTGATVATQPMHDNRDGTYAAQCGPLPEGSYRIHVRSDEAANRDDVIPIADAFGVSPRVSG